MDLGGYTVRDIGDKPPASPAKLLESVRYPPNENLDVVVSEIGLWEVCRNVGGIFSLSYWRSIFNRAPDYNVILQQRSPIKLGDDVRNFVLHETADLDESKEAFSKIRDTIEPLVDDCTVLLTKDLLEEIILPEPVEPSELSHHLMEVIERNPDAHTDWPAVLRSLALDAIGKDKSEDVQELLDKGVAVDSTDYTGNTMLHRAAVSGSARGLQAVANKLSESEKAQVLAKKNKDGKAAIHVAFEKNNPDVARELVKSGAKLSEASENEEGSNPLHLAAEHGSSATISAVHHRHRNFASSQSPENPERQQLIKALNATNKKGFTPLMVAVRKNYTESVVSLLQAGADLNIKHSETGDTALHFAAREGNEVITKALIAFHADLNIKNNAGKTPVQEAGESSAKGSDKCKNVLCEAKDLVEKALADLTEAVEPAPLDPDSIVLLSMDGGGSRGLITTQILGMLYHRMKQLKPDCAPFHKYFNYIAGTSAGGIFTLAMVYNNADLQTAASTVFKASDEVLPHSPGIPVEVAELSAQETIGPDSKLSDVQEPRVIVMTCVADQNPPELEKICNYSQPAENPWLAWEAARASAAAPVYFPPFKKAGKSYIDGGLVANNPTLDAMVEIVEQSKKETGSVPKFGLVLSIGTGIAPPSDVEDIQVIVPKLRLNDIVKSLVNLPDTISSLQSILTLALSQSTQSNGQEVERARAWCDSIGVPYFRFSPKMEKVVDLSEDDKAELVSLMYVAYVYALKNVKELDKIARLLVSRPVK